ncbi:MAG: transporter substrate-binding domain-containing protein [Rhodospirillales bacterium]|nr:transporter substrate-binding domain-containing protein [Rhodospirillales bacterium]
MGELGGHVRFGLFPSFFYTKDSATGAFSGFGIELARSFAEAQGLTLLLTEYGAPPAVVRALTDNDCDVALLGVDPERGMDVDFSPPYLRADFTFLVQADSRIDRISDVDQPGQRVAVVRNHAMEFALRGNLLRADCVFARTPDEGFDMIQAGHADILAGIRPGLLKYADLLPGSRVLRGRYGENMLAFAVAKGRDDWFPAINRFVLNARTSGLIRRIIQETGLAGAAPVLTP